MMEKISFLKGKKISFRKIGVDKLLYFLLAGVMLLIISIPVSSKKEADSLIKVGKSTKEQEETTLQEGMLEITEETYEKLLEARLEEVLSFVEGAGKIKVMVTLKASGEKIILTESPYVKNTVQEQDSGGGIRNATEFSQSDTVIYIEESGKKVPYMIQETMPEIEGILVIAQGADKEAVKKELNMAIAALFDLQSHKIKVCKMAD